LKLTVVVVDVFISTSSVRQRLVGETTQNDERERGKDDTAHHQNNDDDHDEQRP